MKIEFSQVPDGYIPDKFWRVRFYVPRVEPERYGKNHNAIVVADTAVEAGQCVLRFYPTAQIDAIVHEGGDLLIVDRLPEATK